MLAVGNGQQIYWEEWGSPEGVPALYLHGGPGGGLGNGSYRHRFDLARTRVVGLDQRGCGRSIPHASEMSTSLAANTTAHLIHDMERLRELLSIDAWIINGVSWGSTLALAYAQTHPERVRGLVLFAVTTTSRREVDWITEGVGAVFPEAWDCFACHAEQSGIGYERGHGRLVEAYGRLMESPDPAVRDAASREWALWETLTSRSAPEALSETRVGTRSVSGLLSCVSPRTTGPTTGSATLPSSNVLSFSEIFRGFSSMVGVTSHRQWSPHGSCTKAGQARSSWLTRVMVTSAPG